MEQQQEGHTQRKVRNAVYAEGRQKLYDKCDQGYRILEALRTVTTGF